MGYNLASAFLPELPRPKFFQPFEGPVKGFAPNGDKVLISTAGQLNKGKTEAMLLDLREGWIRRFVCHLTDSQSDGYPPREWSLAWLDASGTFPKTAEELIRGLNNPSEIQRAALACLDAWHAL